MNPEQVFRILGEKKDEFLRRFSLLSRRAERLGLASPDYCLYGPYLEIFPSTDEYPLGRVIHCYYATVSGSAPKLDGWRLIAALEPIPTEEGETLTFTRIVPGEALPEKYRSPWTGNCDHCGTHRARKSVFALANAAGETKQVGSTCLKDFLGWDSPTDIALWCGWYSELTNLGGDDEFWGSGSSGWTYLNLGRLLSYTCAVLDAFPWVSMKVSREFGGIPTRDLVLDRVFPPPSPSSDYAEFKARTPVEPRHLEEAEAIIEWGKALPSSTDYNCNVICLCSAGLVHKRGLGIAVSMAAVYRQEKAKLAELASTTLNEFFGTEGERVKKFRVTPTSSRSCDGAYGVTHLLTFKTPEGHSLKWFASGSSWFAFTDSQGELLTGHWFLVDGTIKRHEVYKGVRQTMLTRVKVHGEVAPA